jgi:hypothetical protein
MIQYYANLILKDDPVIVKKTPELLKYLTDTAKDIYSDPKRNSRGRSYDTVYQNTCKMVIEIALFQRTGFPRNPKPFDKKDPDSYIWDNIDPKTSIKFDCISQEYNDELTFHKLSVKTKFKHAKDIDFIISAKQKDNINHFSVFFTRIIDAKTFELCTKNRSYDILEYNDVAAIRRGYCIKYETKCEEVYG